MHKFKRLTLKSKPYNSCAAGLQGQEKDNFVVFILFNDIPCNITQQLTNSDMPNSAHHSSRIREFLFQNSLKFTNFTQFLKLGKNLLAILGLWAHSTDCSGATN